MNKTRFLKTQKILRLVTLESDGTPHIVPVWYLYRNKKFYVGTNSKTRKAKNLRKKKRVAYCVDVGVKSPDIIGVMGQGKAKLITKTPEVKKIAKDILLRYFTSMRSKSAIELYNDTDCIIEITPLTQYTWEY